MQTVQECFGQEVLCVLSEENIGKNRVQKLMSYCLSKLEQELVGNRRRTNWKGYIHLCQHIILTATWKTTVRFCSSACYVQWMHMNSDCVVFSMEET